ncbi:MAG: DUF2207 domain-containing protein [Pseudobdellovibrionaceae bacterium]|jgi:uncharacterized membrane protein|nr:DUF2207 domain-containing protein [Pseudobdellovibrionaceae bacterium]
MKKFLLLLALCVIQFTAAQVARAEEVIKSFDVIATIDTSGDVLVTEYIRVISEHAQIKRGIFRDIPEKYKDRFGNQVSAPISVLDIRRDGEPEEYHTQPMSNGTRIYIGNKDQYVSIGEHVYVITYKVRNAIGYFDDVDELYWNVTGNSWDFRIESASIQVRFPEGAKVIRAAAYTGTFGQQGKNYFEEIAQNDYFAQTKIPLGRFEGITVAAGIAKGVLIAPTGFDKALYFLEDNKAWVVFILGTMLLFTYLLVMWQRYGDDTSGTIVPRFDIPTGITPSFLRYIWRQGFDQVCFTAELIHTAMKGYIAISEDGSYTILQKKKALSDNANSYVLTMQNIFDDGPRVEIPNGGFKSSQRSQAYAMSGNFLSSSAKLQRLVESKQDMFFSLNGIIKRNAILIALVTMSLVFWLGNSEEQKALILIITVASHIGMIVAFWAPMNKYTGPGQDLADYAEGLKMYLSVAEEARLNALYPENITPEIFEKFLPYAFALGVEQKWCSNFEKQISQTMKSLPRDEQDRWRDSQMRYLGRTLQFSSLGAMTDSLASMNSVISSASTPPSSSSGSGGGGSSGGGGGGGGGGGW